MLANVTHIRKKDTYIREVRKRSYKHFNKQGWNEELNKKDWSSMEKSSNVNEMVKIYTELNIEALNKCAPFKTFKIKSHYKFCLSEETKDLMRKRDNIRLQMKAANKSERVILHSQYKKLRNSVNKRVRLENIHVKFEFLENLLHPLRLAIKATS